MRLTDRGERVILRACPVRPARKQPHLLDDGPWRIASLTKPLLEVRRVVRSHSCLQAVPDRVLPNINTRWHVASFCMWKQDYDPSGL